jgi:hypothetical protein
MSWSNHERDDLPAIEVVAPGALAAAECDTDQPQHQQNDSGDPQQVEGESRAEEDQHEEEGKEEDHAPVLPPAGAGQTGNRTSFH